MDLELHQLDRRYEALRTRSARRERRLLSSLSDTDFTEAVARFQTLQNALQATLQTTGQMLNLSLLDFLG